MIRNRFLTTDFAHPVFLNKLFEQSNWFQYTKWIRKYWKKFQHRAKVRYFSTNLLAAKINFFRTEVNFSYCYIQLWSLLHSGLFLFLFLTFAPISHFYTHLIKAFIHVTCNSASSAEIKSQLWALICSVSFLTHDIINL